MNSRIFLRANRAAKSGGISQKPSGALLSAIAITLLASVACFAQNSQSAKEDKSDPNNVFKAQPIPYPRDPTTGAIVVTPRINPGCPVRLGGVYLSGLNTPSKSSRTPDNRKISVANRNWIARNLDIVALSHTDIDLATFPEISKINRQFTPLLYFYASCLYETERHGNVGGWKPEMSTWALKDSSGKEIRHPDSGGHWMDFNNQDWTNHWTTRVNFLSKKYGADGVVAAEPPLSAPISLYSKDIPSAAKTTLAWLESIQPNRRVMLLPSSVGFELASPLPKPLLKPGMKEEIPDSLHEAELVGRLWNSYFSRTEGAWAEGWLRPYWADKPVSESVWEMQVEAADRASFSGQPFIVAAGYKNESELEYALASYLLIAKRQGRVVFQPMPIIPNGKSDSGFDLGVLQKEAKKWQKYFRVSLGPGTQERHQIPVEGGLVWHRRFEKGEVYVNSNEHKTVRFSFGGKMQTVDGKLVQVVKLPPQTGIILLNDQ